MKLYFLRHGPAESRDGWQRADDERTLTLAGEIRIRQVARGMRRLALSVSTIVTSPLPRALQTAHLVAEELLQAEQVVQSPLLAPGFDREALLKILIPYRHREGILLVGHEPDFSLTIGALVGGATTVLKKGALCRVDLASADDSHGTLRWLIPPRILAKLGQ